jgi:ribosomal protein L32
MASSGAGIVRQLAQQCRRRLLGGVWHDWGVVLPALSLAGSSSGGLRRRPRQEQQQQHQQQQPWQSSGSWWVAEAAVAAAEEEEEEEGHVALGLDGLGLGLDPYPEAGEAEGSPSSSWWWGGLLRMAVPKKKVSHRRQRRKLVRYDGENVVHAYPCPACGKPKLRHRLCDDYETCAQQAPAKYQRRGGGGKVGDGEGRREGQGEGSRA